MEQYRQTLLDNIIQIQDIINTSKPICIDYTIRTKFFMETKLISNLEELTKIVTTNNELNIINDILSDLVQSLRYKLT